MNTKTDYNDIDIDMLNLQFDKITAREPLDVVWFSLYKPTTLGFDPQKLIVGGVTVSWPCGWMTKLHVRYKIINHEAPPEKQVLVIESATVTKFFKEYPIDINVIRNSALHSQRIDQILKDIRDEESKITESVELKFNRALNRVIKGLR